MDNLVTVLVAFISTGGIAITSAAVRKTWSAKENAGYQRRIKEEQAEESLEAISELESEVMDLTADLTDEQKRRIDIETFALQQQEIIADQAKALANLDPEWAVL